MIHLTNKIMIINKELIKLLSKIILNCLVKLTL